MRRSMAVLAQTPHQISDEKGDRDVDGDTEGATGKRRRCRQRQDADAPYRPNSDDRKDNQGEAGQAFDDQPVKIKPSVPRF